MKSILTTSLILFLCTSTAFAQRGRRDRSPKVGDKAPNFKAKVIGADKHVELKDMLKKKKPVVLIFGSYT